MTRHRALAGLAVTAALLGPAGSAAQPAGSAAPLPTAAPSAAPDGTGSEPAPPAPTAAPSATPAEDAGALFHQGREAFKANDFARALDLFQKSFALEATPGTLLNIALTEENLGKTATALRSFQRVVGLLKADDDRMPIAKEGVARTTLRAPHLKVERAAGAPPTMAIRIDGVPLAANLVGVAQPLDPGPHVVTTSVYGFEDRQYDITLTEGQRVPLAVEPGKRTLVAAPVVTGPTADAGAPSAGRVLSLTLAGAGLAGLGMGIASGVLALSKADELAAACPDRGACSGPALRTLGEARTWADISTGTLIFGGVATAAGVVMLFTVGGGKSVFVSASAAPGAGGIQATGRF